MVAWSQRRAHDTRRLQVDAPVIPSNLANIAAEFKKAVGTGKDTQASNGVDILGSRRTRF